MNRLRVPILQITCTFLLLVGMLGSSVPAQAQGTVSLTIDELVLDDFPTVEVLVTVRDENGTPITDLTADKFELIEDGKTSLPPQEVSTKVNEDVHISVALVIDVSGSMKGDPLAKAQEAANEFIDKLADADRVALIAFSDDVEMDLDNLNPDKEVAFTNDKNAVRNVLNFLEAGGGTALYDAAYKAVLMTAEEPPGKRAIILMTDGRDEDVNDQPPGSHYTEADDPINEATRQQIPVFTIGLGQNVDEKYLRRMALRTGGRFQLAPEPDQLSELFQNILEQLKQQYILTYESRLPEDANPHSLMVRVKLPTGQAYDERKFYIKEPPTPVPTQVAAPAATSTPVPTPTPQPEEEEEEKSKVQQVVDDIKDWVQDHKPQAIGIAVAVLLLFILLIVLLIVLMRRRGAYEEYPEEYEEYALPPEPEPAWPSPAAPPLGPTPMPEVPPTQVAPEQPTGPGIQPTEVPAPGAPPTAPAPGFPPPPTPGVPPVAPPVAPTRIIERAPKHLAMLIDKKQPSNKFDVKDGTTIGRARDNDIILPHPTVSRQHAKVRLQEGTFLLFDLGSSNGTFVNDERVLEPRQLKDGDVVRFGEVEMIFKSVF